MGGLYPKEQALKACLRDYLPKFEHNSLDLIRILSWGVVILL
jgi:hypothetical protein